MKTLFTELNKVLPPYELNNLKKGASNEELNVFAKKIERVLPLEFKLLYQWHNGSTWKLIDDKPPIFIFNFFDLDEIINYEYWFIVQMIEDFAFKKLIPIGEIEELGLILMQSGENSPIYIYYSVDGDGELEIWHESFEAMLKTSIDFFGNLDNEGRFKKEFEDIRLSYSPNTV